VAVVTGVIAGSILLVGFGIDTSSKPRPGPSCCGGWPLVDLRQALDVPVFVPGAETVERSFIVLDVSVPGRQVLSNDRGRLKLKGLTVAVQKACLRMVCLPIPLLPL
jgi:hypothetical protein